MNQQFLQDLSSFGDFLKTEQDFGIVMGNHQNIDTVAASLSLYLSLKQAGKNVQIVSVKEPLVEVSNLVGVNKIERSFKGDTTKLVVALPYIKGEVEKVLFTEQENTINFHLTAAQGRTITPFELDQVKLNWEGGSPNNIIAIGVGSINEIDGIIDVENSKIVNIDNYSSNNRFGDTVLVDESMSSMSEIIAKVIKEQGLPFDTDIAQNILDGVLFATRNFTKSNTSPLAFEAASSAMYQGAQRKVEERQPSQTPANRSFQGGQRNESASTPASTLGGQRNDQSYPQSSRSSQFQERLNRDQGQNRGSRQQPQDNRSQRSSGSDFPAMHMQGRVSQNPTRGSDNRSVNNPARNIQSSAQGFQNRNVNDIRNKIIEESRPQAPFQSLSDSRDPQIFEEARANQPIEEVHFPEDTVSTPVSNQSLQGEQRGNQNFSTPSTEDVPDDWLMPKVFKSSKNNN